MEYLAVLVFQLGQHSSQKNADLRQYGTLWQYRNAASKRITFLKFIEKMVHTVQQMWHPSVAMMTLTLPLMMPEMAQVTHHSRSEADRVTAVAWGSNKTQVTPAKMSAKMYKKHERDVTDKE
jgi:hypothetical protein